MLFKKPKFVNKLLSKVFRSDLYIYKLYQVNRQYQYKRDELTIIGGKGYNKWVHFKCPCGCNEVINLSLMKSHSPCWKLKIDLFSRPTLWPSIWKKDGCESHFWIKKGRIIWCEEEQDYGF